MAAGQRRPSPPGGKKTMAKYGCPCCASIGCGKPDAWWRDGDGGAPSIVGPAGPEVTDLGVSDGHFRDDIFILTKDEDGPSGLLDGPVELPLNDSVPGGVGSTASVAVGGHVVVTVDTTGDRDWYRVDLVAGQTYTIHTSGVAGSNPDPFISLRSSTGAVIASNDDGGDALNSLISYTATATGTFFIEAGTFADQSVGSFRLSVSTAVSPSVDIAASTATTVDLAVGGGVNSLIDASGDRDWFRINLVAGQTYVFRTGSTLPLAGTSPAGRVDTVLTLRDAAGNQLATNDDAGEYDYSSIRFTATTSGTYYLDVSGFGTATGQYNLTAFTTDPLTLFTNDQIANQLTNGYWGGVSRRWNVTAGGEITYNLANLTAAGQALAVEAYALWSDVTGITFRRDDSAGSIVHDDNQQGAFAQSTINFAGFITGSTVNVGTEWLTTYGTNLNSYSFQTYVHEIGHAIGLGHGGNYNGAADYASDALYLNDSWATTVMSYFDQNENTYFGSQGFTRQFAVSPMIADGVAMIALYGTAMTTRTGDTVYGFNNTSGREIYNAVTNPNVSYTIFDHGGTDTLDYSGFTQTQRINLNAEAFSDVGGRIGNVVIARGTVIENVVGGSGNDTIIGNGVANRIDLQQGGTDTVNAGGGDDTIVMGSTLTAADTIDGGSGSNDQVGISGNYAGGLTLGATTLTNVEVLALLPGAGNSYAITSNDATVAAGVEMTIFAGNLGAGQNFTFDGSAETNGNFRTFGGLGTDIITGGAGNDGFYFGPDKWQVGDSVTGGGGANDQLALDGNYTTTIGANADVEVLVLLPGPVATPGTFNITLSDAWAPGASARTVFARNTTTGVTINGAAESSANLTIFGGFGSDTLRTGGGNDIIFGLEGNDSIFGGAGSSDTARYQGLRATYSVVTSGGNVQIVDNDAAADGNDGTDTVVGIEFAQFADQTISITSPIILDLDGGGVETLSAAQSNARYDMDGDGIGDDTSWFGRGEGLLFLDRDGNGTLSNAGEMSFTGDVDGARSDLEGLAAFDSNGDGQLSSADARFREFRIWRDRDGDGVVDRREIMTLARAGVRSLSLTGTANNAAYALGDTAVVNTGSFTRTNGRQGGLIDAVLTAVSSKAATTSTAPSLDPNLLGGSFADAVAQLDAPAPEQRSLPALVQAEAVDTALPAQMAVSDGSTAAPISLDQTVLLMRQDMAAFATNSAATSTWRRDEARPMEMFAA